MPFIAPPSLPLPCPFLPPFCSLSPSLAPLLPLPQGLALRDAGWGKARRDTIVSVSETLCGVTKSADKDKEVTNADVIRHIRCEDIKQRQRQKIEDRRQKTPLFLSSHL